MSNENEWETFGENNKQAKSNNSQISKYKKRIEDNQQTNIFWRFVQYPVNFARSKINLKKKIDNISKYGQWGW